MFHRYNNIFAALVGTLAFSIVANNSLLAAPPEKPVVTATVEAAVSAGPASVIKTAGDRNSATSQNSKRSSLRGQVRTVAMELLNRSGKRITTKYGITLDEASLKAADATRPLVIVVHGYNSSPQRVAPLSELVRKAGYPVGAFGYPNDQAIADSAALLSRELTQLKNQFPTRRIVLLTHSMGGIVARETIENPANDPGNVAQLIMISPPSHGTSWAHISCSGDYWEYGLNGENCFLDRLYCSFEDGLGEARYDLQPESAFLKTLNARPRNANVQYSMFLGTGTKFSRAKLEHAHQVVNKCCEENRFLSVIKPALDCTFSDLQDAVEEGDGVVCISRGKLDGVEDVTLLGFDHWNVTCNPQPQPLSEPVAQLHREILTRLASLK